jgi:hypothetical protein
LADRLASDRLKRQAEPVKSKRRVGISTILLVVLIPFRIGAPASGAESVSPDVARFEFERPAQNHCPGEAIVWVDARSQTYDVSTNRLYGRTSTGAFVCLQEAVNAGYRDHDRNRDHDR